LRLIGLDLAHEIKVRVFDEFNPTRTVHVGIYTGCSP
jgi:hypothetical protein